VYLLLWDASALAQRYAPEIGQPTINALFGAVPRAQMITTVISYSEACAALVRKRNQGALDAATFTVARSALRAEVIDDPDFGVLMCCGRFAERSKMAKKARNIGKEILEALREIKRGEYGRVINVPDVADTREKTGLSQARFAQLLGVSVRTLQDWEQGRRVPSGAARTLILIAAKNPQVLLEVG